MLDCFLQQTHLKLRAITHLQNVGVEYVDIILQTNHNLPNHNRIWQILLILSHIGIQHLINCHCSKSLI